MNRAEAKAAVAAHAGLASDDFAARPAGGGAWWVSERDVTKMLIDDMVWVVLANGFVGRAVPPGHPWLPATDLASLSDD